MANRQSLTRELAKLKAEIEALKGSASTVWGRIFIDPKSEVSVEAQEAEQTRKERERLGCDPLNWVVTTIVYPPLHIMESHEELPPELKLIGDETRKRLADEAETARRNAARQIPRPLPREERPFPLGYPPLKY